MRPSCLRAKVGSHLSQSVRRRATHSHKQAVALTATLFRFLYCHTRSASVWSVRPQADTGRTGDNKGITGIKPLTFLKQGSSFLNKLPGIYVEIMGINVIFDAPYFQTHKKFSSWSPRALPGLLIQLAYLPTSIICCLDFQKTERFKNSFLSL